MDPETTKNVTRTEQLNQLVRAICVILLLGAFCFAYLWGVLQDKPIVDSAAFIGVLTLALTWFFKSRDEQHRKTDGTPAPVNGAASAPPAPLKGTTP